MTATMCLIMEK